MSVFFQRFSYSDWSVATSSLQLREGRWQDNKQVNALCVLGWGGVSFQEDSKLAFELLQQFSVHRRLKKLFHHYFTILQ